MDKYFLLERKTRDLPNCTIGKLYAVDVPENSAEEFKVVDIGYTCELPYLDNQENESCVCPGKYGLVKHQSAHLKQTVIALENYELGVTLNGPSQRDHIYLHIANFPAEIDGCIAPGTKLHPEKWGVLGSSDAMAKILELFEQGYKSIIIR